VGGLSFALAAHLLGVQELRWMFTRNTAGADGPMR
jgi:hypothetical protein